MTDDFIEQAEILVDGRRVVGHASRRLFGTIVEPIGACIYGGLWAELLINRKFWTRPDQAEQTIVEGWVLVSKSEGTRASLDDQEPYSPPYCVKITPSEAQTGDDPLRQTGIVMGKGRSYRGYLYIRSEIGQCRLRLSLMNEGRYLFQKDFEGINPDWQRYEFELTSPETGEVDISLTAFGDGPMWVDSISLMPADNEGGIRWDVLEVIRRLKPALIRFPGGCFADTYHWRLGIGDRDRRPAFWNDVYDVIEVNDFGTDEFIEFCRAVEAEPYFNANFGSSSPRDAAEWISYCNGPLDSPLGNLRACHGHPEPYNVLLWGVGNEIYGSWEVGHTNAASYALRFCEFQREMKAADPRVELVAVGCDPHPMYDPVWNATLLKHAAASIDYLSIHKYVPGSGNKNLARYDPGSLYQAIVASPVEIERLLRSTEDLIDVVAPMSKKIKVALDEWNVWLHFNIEEGVDERHELRDALYAAGVFNALRRLSPRVGFAIQSLLINVLGAIKVDALSCSVSPVGRAFELYANHSGESVLDTRVRSQSFEVPHTDELPWRRDVPYLDASTTLDPLGRRLYLAVVNRHPTEPITSSVQISSVLVSLRAVIWELNGPDVNSTGDEVDIIEGSFNAGSGCFEYTFPAHSVTIIEFTLV